MAQFCSNLGDAKQQADRCKRRHKQHAMGLLDAHTTAELTVEARVGKKVDRLHGPTWARGVAAEQRDESSDLFGSARAGARDPWEPVTFGDRPGPWFEDEDSRKRNALSHGGRRTLAPRQPRQVPAGHRWQLRDAGTVQAVGGAHYQRRQLCAPGPAWRSSPRERLTSECGGHNGVRFPGRPSLTPTN